jgi:hypothetical protein
LLRSAGNPFVVVSEWRIEAGVSVCEDGAEAKVGGLKIPLLLLEGTSVQYTKHLRSLLVGYIGDELEGIIEGRYNEGIIVCKGTFSKVKANRSSVDNDESWNILARFVHDDCSQCSL